MLGDARHARYGEGRTGLSIGGESRATDEVLRVADPAKPSVIVGEAAASAQPGWAALSSQERAAAMAEAIADIAAGRDEDAAILSQENGKIRFDALAAMAH